MEEAVKRKNGGKRVKASTSFVDQVKAFGPRETREVAVFS